MEEVEDERTGQIKKRYVNKSRAIGFAPQRIGHGHTLGEVPTEPVEGVKHRMDKLDQGIIAKFRKVRLMQYIQEREDTYESLRSWKSGRYGNDQHY